MSATSSSNASPSDILIAKHPKVTATAEVHQNADSDPDEDASRQSFTYADRKDMNRLGRPQEFNRNFRALSTLSFTIVVQATWEFILISMTQGLTNGGFAGLFWSYVWTFIGFTPIVASLAEMASMCVALARSCALCVQLIV